MTTPHQIGELLRTGVRPTDEEVQHLTALGGFATEVLGRYLDGRPPAYLQAGSASWSERLSSRLSASTAERWQRGLGLADLLLEHGIGGWWEVSRSGFASGYEGFDPEMDVLALFEEDVPDVAARDDAAVAQRRGSLFGAKTRPPKGRLAPSRMAKGLPRAVQASDPTASVRAGRWADGALAELTVLKALAAGGLPVADQLVDIVEPIGGGEVGPGPGLSAEAQRWAPSARRGREASGKVAKSADQAVRPMAGVGRSASFPSRQSTRSVQLDGLRIDSRTPALATALERADSVFGRAGGLGPAVSAERIAALTSAIKVSIDRGLGAGERPVFGFFDAVESTFLSLAPEPAAGQAAPTLAGAVPVAMRGATPTRPVHSGGDGAATARLARSRSDASATPGGKTAIRVPSAAAEARRAAGIPISLDSIVRPVAGATFRPLTAGVFAAGRSEASGEHPRHAMPTPLETASSSTQPMLVATQFRYTPQGVATPRAQRSGMSAPRIETRTLHGLRFASQQARVEGPSAPSVPMFASEQARSGAPSLHMAGAHPSEAFVLERDAAFVEPGDGAPAVARAPREPIGPTTWRLAVDRGPDMPLGASFSRAEVFGATHSAAAGSDVRAARHDFCPVVAQPREEAAARINRMASAVDGLVWLSVSDERVAEPQIGSAASASERLPLAAVPRGRAAAMVAAGSALAAITQAAVAPSSSVRNLSAARRLEGAVLDTSAATPEFSSAVRANVAGTRGNEVLERIGGRNVGGSSYAAAVESLLRSGVLADSGRVPVREVGQDVIGWQPSAVASAFRTSVTSAASGSASLAAGFLGGDAAAGEEPAGVSAHSDAVPVSPVTLGRGLDVSRGPSSRWLEATMRGSAGAIDLQRAVARAIVSGYQRLDGERVMLAISGELNRAGLLGESAPKEQWRPIQVRSAIAGRPSAAASTAIEGDRGASPRRGATDVRQALLRPVVTARESRVVAGVLGSLASGGGRNDGQPQSGFGVGRSATSLGIVRAIGSAPETEAAMDVVGSGGLARFEGEVRAQAPERTAFGFAGFARGATAMARDAVMLGSAARGANEPVLSRLVADRQLSQAAGLAEAWNVDGGVLERIASLGAAGRVQVARSLADAGWTAPELAMLSLPPVDGVSEGRASDVGAVAPRVQDVARRPDVVGLVRGPMVATSSVGREGMSVAGGEARDSEPGTAPAAARVDRMGQNLARVLGGVEGLGASVSDPGAGVAGRAAARMQASAWLPLLGATKGDKYFGGLAPSTSSRSSSSMLRDAIGELVQMAELAAARSDTAVSVEARREVLRRVDAVRARVSADHVAGVAPFSAAGRAFTAIAERSGGASSSATIHGEPMERGVLARAELATSLDDTLVARTVARGVMDSVPRSELEPAERAMRIPEAERTIVGLAGEPRTDARGAMSTPTGLERRVVEALALAASGPAGARRLTTPVAGAVSSRGGVASSVAPMTAQRLPAKRGGGASAERGERVDQLAEPGIERASSKIRRDGGLASAAMREEAAHALPIGLGKVLAPEVMLSGLRSGELVKAMDVVAASQSLRGWDAVGVLTTLSDAGIDLGAARSALPDGAADVVARARAAVGGRDMGSGVSPRLQSMVRDAARLGGSTQRALVDVLAGGDAEQAVARAGLSRRERAGLLSAVLRGTERAERSSLLEQAGGSDFAFAWLARVDGTRSGLDIGLGDTKAEFGRTFGRRRDSALAGASPLDGASLVSTGASARSPGSDRSGLRAVAAQFVHTSTGAARPQHGASDAMRRTDWRFVETGSRASTAHADLGKLAAAIVGSSETARRAPMPLVAPAAKAVAQTALRKSKRETVASGRGGRGGGGGAAKPAEAKMSEQAIESLAIEMATRVARLMGLMKERIGVW